MENEEKYIVEYTKIIKIKKNIFKRRGAKSYR